VFHNSRHFRLSQIESIEELCDATWEYINCPCTAFQLGDLILACDATGPDGAQEWAAFVASKKIQVESFTVSWMKKKEWLNQLHRLVGKIKGGESFEWQKETMPIIDEVHAPCYWCR